MLPGPFISVEDRGTSVRCPAGIHHLAQLVSSLSISPMYKDGCGRIPSQVYRELAKQFQTLKIMGLVPRCFLRPILSFFW